MFKRLLLISDVSRSFVFAAIDQLIIFFFTLFTSVAKLDLYDLNLDPWRGSLDRKKVI